MTIAQGKRLGPYEILAPAGGGGMGEVYRAKDTRLDRIVAIKVLPDHAAGLAESRERFEREARAIAGLNHPHICVLYDVGHQDDTEFLVMEFIEGETLAHRLLKGPLPLQQVLQYAIQIADALDKAHRMGVTHRDLKPANIMLTKSGIKLLDFGLAKLQSNAATTSPLSELTTAKDNITAQGTIIGTLQYMAPEQLESKEVDARTDIFALGAVVYEMATGKKAFGGTSHASVISAIMSSDPPPMSTLQPMSPPALDRAVKRCLAKDPDKRWQTASDLREELQWIGDSEMQTPAAGAAFPSKAAPAVGKGRQLLLWSAVSLAIAVLTGLLAWNFKPAASSALPVIRSVIALPPGQQLDGLNSPAVALSADGSRLAYVAIRDGVSQIYLRPLDSLEATPIPGTENGASPFFSADGQWIGFFAGGKLRKIPISGGTSVALDDATTPRGATWSSRGVIVFAPTSAGGLQQIPDAGGSATPLTQFKKGETTHRWPQFLPGGRSLLFAVGSGFAAGGGANLHIVGYSVSAGQQYDVAQTGTQPEYVPGYLVYIQAGTGTLMAVPFDAKRMAVTGTAIPAVESVLQSTPTAAAQYAVSENGSLVYVGGEQTSQRNLVWVSRDGSEQTLAAPPRRYQAPRLSPDGRRIAASIDSPTPQVWIYDLTRDALTRLTFEGTYNRSPTWTPDGKRVAVISNKDGALNIYSQSADGGGSMERLNESKNITNPSSFSPDGRLLAMDEIDPVTQQDIAVLQVSDHKEQPFLHTVFNESAARFSPDGHWLAYASDESGRREIYVQSFPGPEGKWQISTDGGTEPVWNPKGHELFYRNGDKMMAVDISTQPNFSAGKPRMLFAGQFVAAAGSDPNYDVSPDGQRFLMLEEAEPGTSTASAQIIVVQNWVNELKRRGASDSK